MSSRGWPSREGDAVVKGGCQRRCRRRGVLKLREYMAMIILRKYINLKYLLLLIKLIIFLNFDQLDIWVSGIKIKGVIFFFQF